LLTKKTKYISVANKTWHCVFRRFGSMGRQLFNRKRLYSSEMQSTCKVCTQ